MNPPDSPPQPEAPSTASQEPSFEDVLRQFEADRRAEENENSALEGTVVSVAGDAIVVDVGRKMEGLLSPHTPGLPAGLAPGAQLKVNITGRTADGYYTLSTIKVIVPKDFSGLQSAFESKSVIPGVVTELVKGGLRVEVAGGVQAFLPASRSGIREMADLPGLTGQTIECRITKLDLGDPERPGLVVDRRAVLEEQSLAARQAAFDRLEEGQVVQGAVKSLTGFGAFVEIAPGVDALLHVADMSWTRVEKPETVVSAGQAIGVKILKINRAARKVSVGMKQLRPDPWTETAAGLREGERVRGKVVRLADFGAFVELAPGVDGLIHLSEMSWTRRVRKPGDVLQLGEMVEAVVLEVKPAEKRIALGLKQALGNPWDSAGQNFPPGSTVEAPVVSLAPFGAFVDLGGGLEGMIHVGDITRARRIEHPKEALSPGQVVKAAVLEVDREKKRIRLSMKQLEPTSADIFIAEHAVGDLLTGRVVEVHGQTAKVELSEGVHARCRLQEEQAARPPVAASDITGMAALLSSRWKGGEASGGRKNAVQPGQLRRFRITAADPGARKIELEIAD
jgi:small subunit ribosomal protein S1